MKLYYLPTCPHCHKVINWIEDHNLTSRFEFIDVDEQAGAQQLLEIEPQGAVPCLLTEDGAVVVGDTPIIEYLEANLPVEGV